MLYYYVGTQLPWPQISVHWSPNELWDWLMPKMWCGGGMDRCDLFKVQYDQASGWVKEEIPYETVHFVSRRGGTRRFTTEP